VTGQPTDADLVADYLATEDPALFEALVRRHWERVVRIVLSIVGPEHAMESEDLAQQALIRAHDTLDSFRGEARFTTWLYRIASNQAIDHARRTQRRRRLLRSAQQPIDPPPVEKPDASALADERARRVRAAVARLPHPYRTALRLHYWHGLSVAEIADSLGVASGTAKSYLHRGRKRLHVLLDDKEVPS
jgi:RNA polymerase sigma-70 factor (ECF subfamily)